MTIREARCPAEQRDELAAGHRMTAFAKALRARRGGGDGGMSGTPMAPTTWTLQQPIGSPLLGLNCNSFRSVT
jgi:hypothetical protein